MNDGRDRVREGKGENVWIRRDVWGKPDMLGVEQGVRINVGGRLRR